MTTLEMLERFRLKVGEEKNIRMRAEEGDKIHYIDRYRERGEEEGFDPDWELFIRLWDRRRDSDDDMAELLSEVMGVAHDETLAWIREMDTP